MFQRNNHLPLLFVLVFLFFGMATRAQDEGLRFSPAKLFFKLGANQSGMQKVAIINNSRTQTFILEGSFQDWERDSLAKKIYFPAGTLPHGLSKYLKLSPSTITLAPGESKTVDVSLQLPQGADTMVGNSMLMLTQLKENKLLSDLKQKKAMMNIFFQLAIHVYNEPAQFTIKNMEIEDLQLVAKALNAKDAQKDSAIYHPTASKDSSKKSDTLLSKNYSIKGYLHNTGELITEGNFRLELLHQTSSKEFKLVPIPFNCFPAAKFITVQALPNDLPKGKYTATAIVDFGTDQELKVAETQIILE